MASEVVPVVRIQAQDFDVADEIARLTDRRADIGAVVTFTGLCRDEQGALSALELEHYPGMAEAEIARIAAEAVQRWPLQGLTAIHRHGRIEPGRNIVLVVAASAHRQAAFEAGQFPHGLSEVAGTVLEEGTPLPTVRKAAGSTPRKAMTRTARRWDAPPVRITLRCQEPCTGAPSPSSFAGCVCP
jgi:molybdopterin synthase catalytic subunit